jgi:hypothetical protein
MQVQILLPVRNTRNNSREHSMNLAIDNFYIVEAQCHRTWPIVLGFQLGPCGDCGVIPAITDPLTIIREPVHSEEDEI